MQGKLVKIVLPVLILIGGGLAAGAVMALSPKTTKAPPEEKALPVEVLVVSPEAAPALVMGTGVVAADREVVILPQVAGQIVEISDKLTPGGRFSQGDVLARIDPRDYKLALRSEQSRVQAAELDLALEKKRSGIAEKEWQLLGEDVQSSDPALALRKPQLALSQVNLESARSGLERARLSLERTRLTSPFNSVVVTENVDVGQVVGAATQVARLIGTDRFRVMVSVPVEALASIHIPGVSGDASHARIVQRLGPGQTIVREGEVLRLAGELDPQTRRAQLLVSVESPLDGPDGGLPMLPGAFVEVSIEGRAFDGVYKVPRASVRQGKELWVVDENTQLASREVEILWGDDDVAVVSGGLKPGDQVVTSALSVPLPGTSVTITRTSQGL